MKKRHALIIVLVAWLPMFIGAWDKDKPAATTTMRASNPQILANNVALETALGANHEFSTGGTNSGKHTTIVMQEQSSITTAANEMGLYCKDLGTAPGLYLRPQSDGTAIQWSDISAKIVNAAMAADSIDSAQYVDGSIDAVHLAADVIDETKIADDGIDSEHYNDGSIDAAHLATDVIDETKLADDGIDSEHYNDGSIDNVHLASDVITSGTTPIFGSWTAKDSGTSDDLVKDEVYRVGSDGFVCAYANNNPSVNMIIYSDGSNPPTTLRMSVQSYASDREHCFTIPVRKNDYWEINAGAAGATPVIQWLPIGTGTCVKQ